MNNILHFVQNVFSAMKTTLLYSFLNYKKKKKNIKI